MTHPSTDINDRFGSKTGEERRARTLSRAVVTLADGDDSGDRLPVTGHDDAAAFAHAAEKTRKAAVGIGCGDSVIHNRISDVVIFTIMSEVRGVRLGMRLSG
jgi:regulator of protease activity HflC (stomatin/prohibitin superfamily)